MIQLLVIFENSNTGTNICDEQSAFKILDVVDVISLL